MDSGLLRRHAHRAWCLVWSPRRPVCRAGDVNWGPPFCIIWTIHRCDGAVFSISFQWTPLVPSHLHGGEHDQSGSFFSSPRAFLTPAGHKPITLCPRLPLRPLPSARLARPSLLPFIPPLPGPGRPAESLAWRCVAGALLGAKLAVCRSGDSSDRFQHGDHLGSRGHGEDLYMSHAPTRHSHGITRSATVLDVQKVC